MPRTSSTSFITGTGFMKWMPMKRSGRSVCAASRVIEIDEVLVARIASGLRMRAELRKDLALDGLVLGRRLDHQVGAGQALHVRRCRDAGKCGPAHLVVELAGADLAGHDCR